MNTKWHWSNLRWKEIFFIVFLNILVFIFYAFDKRIPGFEPIQLLFFLNFAIAGLIINYFLLPVFLYKNRYVPFIIGIIVVVVLVIFVEEAVLERIFYPDTRGRRISSVFSNLLNTLPTLTILAGFKFAWDALLKQKEVLQLRDSLKETELQFLKSQINPHFLFNNMNNLYAHAIEQSPKTPEIILELSSVLRYFLYECKTKYVPLKKEISQLENYVNLNRLHVEGRGEVEMRVNGDFGTWQIAPLILTVFIENAFKHSASSLTKDIEIEIVIEVSDKGILSFMCSNSYTTESNTQSITSGIGLKNVKKRLDLLYPNRHELFIDTENQNYKVDLQMNLNTT